ncbi:MAG: ATP-binding protein [Bacillota bacterium]|jgi:signal transduction histidine kinase
MLKNRLVAKISVGYLVIALVALLIVGSFFIKLFQDYSYQEKATNMLSHAREITKISGTYLDATGLNASDGSVLELLDSFTNARVWIVASNGDVLYMSRRRRRRDGSGPHYGRSPHLGIAANADRDLIKTVLQGREVVRKGYSNFYREPMLMVGTPIYTGAGQIRGAVFLHAPRIGITAVLHRAYRILGIASLAVIVLIGIMGVFYSRRITQPLQRMNRIALEMAEGNYAVRTNIKLSDEVGQLSRSIDYLAAKLGDTISELERLEQMRKDLISNVSHEFRTPLTLIRGAAETLIDGVAPDERAVRQQYQRILQETGGLERLVNDLLDLSRIQAGKFDLHPEELDLTALVTEAGANLQSIAARKKISIVTDIATPLPPLTGDYYRLRQVLVIFLDNAIKYSEAGTQIVITLRMTDQTAFITIKDQGIGIPPAELQYIWERFYKVDKVRGKSGSGAGLGLTIAKYLIEAHHGRVTVESELGRGTTVEIALPFQSCSAWAPNTMITAKKVANNITLSGNLPGPPGL